MQFGNPLVAGTQFSQGQVDFLGSVASPGAASAVIAATAKRPYSGLYIGVNNPGGPAVGNGLYAQVSGPSGTFSGALPAQPTIAALALPFYSAIIPCQCNTGDPLTITVEFVATPPAGTVISVEGLTSGQPELVRPDGRSYPLASTTATAIFTASGVAQTVVPAPPANQRLLVAGWDLSLQTAGAELNIVGTVNGVGNALLMVFGAGQSVINYENGLLLDPATAISANPSGVLSGRASVLFDIVPA